MGGRSSKAGEEDRPASVATRCSEQFAKRPLKARALGDVHPNVTAKLIHFSLSYFHLITATTCDDEKESGYQLRTTDASV